MSGTRSIIIVIAGRNDPAIVEFEILHLTTRRDEKACHEGSAIGQRHIQNIRPGIDIADPKISVPIRHRRSVRAGDQLIRNGNCSIRTTERPEFDARTLEHPGVDIVDDAPHDFRPLRIDNQAGCEHGHGES